MHEREAIIQLWCETLQRTNPQNLSTTNPVLASLATVVEVRGSAYRRPGARMILTHEGQSRGVINGGCLDADLWRRAREVMADDKAQLAVYDTTAPDDIVWGLGLGCRGVVKILVEPVRDLSWLREGKSVAVHYEGETLGTMPWGEEPPPRPRIVDTEEGHAFVEHLMPPQELIIFGAGADAVPLFQMAQLLGWNVQVINPRAPHPERVAYLAAQHIAPAELDLLALSPAAACVIMTHNFLHDLEVLRYLMRADAPYIGILGPRRRTDELLASLPQDGLVPGIKPSEAQLAALHAPVGLDLGAETPEEIALSIVAEIQKARGARSGQNLRERATIH